MEAKPGWLVVKGLTAEVREEMQSLFDELSLQTVCQNARCPNIGECFGSKTATFMILGNICTRNCRFCAVGKGTPASPDPAEPVHVAEAVKKLGLKHAVITSVTRDDLADGGAGQFAEAIRRVRVLNPGTTVEVLVPDFGGSIEALETVVKAGPDILNHNVETVPGLYPHVRPEALFDRSLRLLENSKQISPGIATKSGIMLGLGETETEVLEVFKSLSAAGCDILTIGQYLRPSKKHIPVHEYIAPDRFKYYKAKALESGFKYVAAGPFVRSSYRAVEGIKLLRQ
ncbi:MAG TPA: lipoyl synthase [Bacillota bacterium]|nr:lipoyl synthase [Bacillota bacterium]